MVNPFPKDFRIFQNETVLKTTNSNLIYMAESSLTSKSQGLFGKGLNKYSHVHIMVEWITNNDLNMEDLGLYSPTILKNLLCLVLQIFLYLAAFECNITSDWLNPMV